MQAAEVSEWKIKQLTVEIEDVFENIYHRRTTENIDKAAFLHKVNTVIKRQGGENEIFTILISKVK